MKGSYCLMRLCWDDENVLSTPESDGAQHWECNAVEHLETATVVNLVLVYFTINHLISASVESLGTGTE